MGLAIHHWFFANDVFANDVSANDINLLCQPLGRVHRSATMANFKV